MGSWTNLGLWIVGSQCLLSICQGPGALVKTWYQLGKALTVLRRSELISRVCSCRCWWRLLQTGHLTYSGKWFQGNTWALSTCVVGFEVALMIHFFLFCFVHLFIIHPGHSPLQSCPVSSCLLSLTSHLPKLLLFSLHLGKDRSPISINETWHIKLQ